MKNTNVNRFNMLLIAFSLMALGCGPEGQDGENNDLIIIDLASPGLNIQQAATVLNDHLRRSAIVYGPHVHHDRFEEAREAGFERLMARGRFNMEVSQIINDFAAK